MGRRFTYLEEFRRQAARRRYRATHNLVKARGEHGIAERDFQHVLRRHQGGENVFRQVGDPSCCIGVRKPYVARLLEAGGRSRIFHLRGLSPPKDLDAARGHQFPVDYWTPQLLDLTESSLALI